MNYISKLKGKQLDKFNRVCFLIYFISLIGVVLATEVAVAGRVVGVAVAVGIITYFCLNLYAKKLLKGERGKENEKNGRKEERYK
jgi:Ca2+/Na+ antiporter